MESRGTNIPVAFYHPDGVVATWNQASKFAGEGGRIATMPDIIDARLATKPGDNPWERYYTTVSAEYFGRSRGGNRIIIVAHGIGPMATLDGIVKAYSYEFKDKSRDNRGGRISKQEFLDLEDGKYGEVDIVDVEALVKRYEYPFLETLTSEQALNEPLIRARLGKKAEEYVQYHTYLARKWHLEQARIVPKNDLGFSEEVYRQYLERREKEHLLSGILPETAYILRMEDPSNCFYIVDSPEDDYTSRLEKWDAPFAHLLTLGALTHMHHQKVESLVSDVDCHEWTNGTRFVAIRQDASVTDIHSGVENLRSLIHRHWRELMQPVSNPTQIGFRPLTKVGKEWFTQYPKKGAGLDTAEPEFHVTKMVKVGKPIEFKTKILGYYGFFKYDIKGVQTLAPTGANAYTFVSEPDNIWVAGNPEFQHADVQFYKVVVDNTKRLIRESQLANDFETLMKLLDL